MKKRYIIITLLLIILDQLSKYFIVRNFNVYDEWIIIKDFLKFEYVQNTGISFGLFSGGRIVIIIASLVVIGFMIYDLLHEQSKVHYFSCLLILSGALGNLIDRVFRGYVVDFISFTIASHKMAIFNLADRLIELKVNEEEEEEDNNDNDNDNDADNDNENENENEKKENMKLNKNEPLSQFTLELLSINKQKDQLKFLDDNINTNIIIKNYITCMNSIFRDKSSDIKSVSYLVIGTENSLIYIINPNEKEPLNKIRIPEVPFLIECEGSYFSEHKIYIADRGCNVYITHKDSVDNKFIIPQPLVNMNITKKNIYISTIGKNFISYSLSGDKIFSIHQPDYITSMEFYYRYNEDIPISIIALKNNQVRLYNDKKLLMIMHLKENIFGMKFGQFGINEECLVLFTYTGSLIIKSFGKDFKFSKLLYDDETNQDEEGKLLIPKKNLLYLDLMDREKDICINMQNIFQNDLLRLRYKAMDTYVKMLKIGNAPQNYSSSSTMKISVSLEGLGPNFKLNLILDNSGNEPIFNGILTIDFNRKIYYFDKESIILSIIMPHVPIKYSLNFKNISETGSSGMIKIIIVDKFQNAPLIQTTIKVPVSELELL